MYPVIQEGRNVTLTETYFTMPDGVRLYTRMVVPKGVSTCPIVLYRDPYEPPHHGKPHDVAAYESNPFIAHGYAVIHQHCRGRGDSEGICRPYVEREDGLATLEAIRLLPFYQGEIYAYGGSYTATVHYAYLGDNPPDVKGAALANQSDSVYYNRYRNGCNMGLCNLPWWTGMIARQFPEQHWEGALKRPYRKVLERIIGQEDPAFTNMIMHPVKDEAWIDERSFCADRMTAPTLFIEGWYDFYLEGMFSVWERLSPETRKRSALILGPWGHATGLLPDDPYPAKGGNLPVDHVVAWFDSLRNGTPYPYAACGEATYYAVGEKAWRRAAYPFSQAGEKTFYLRPDRTVGDAPKGNGEVTYAYDPDRDLDEQGCLRREDVDIFRVFRLKAYPLPAADDVSVFTSAPLTEPLSFFGRPHWRMKVRSDCEDTAFYLRLYLVEDGVAYNLTDTMVPLSLFAPITVRGRRCCWTWSYRPWRLPSCRDRACGST